MMLERPDYWESLESVLEHGRSVTPEDRAERRRRDDDANLTRYRQDLRERAIAQCRAMSEIGARFEERTFENFVREDGNAAALIAALEIADDPTRGAYFWGPPGNGKSHLAGAIVNRCTGNGIPAVFTTGVGLLMKIRDTYTRKGNVREGELDIVERLGKVRVLVLDDVGTENFTVDTGRIFYALINKRYENNLPLIVTANISLAALYEQWKKSGVEEHVSKKIVDRLRDPSMCHFKIEMTGKSRRGVA